MFEHLALAYCEQEMGCRDTKEQPKKKRKKKGRERGGLPTLFFLPYIPDNYFYSRLYSVSLEKYIYIFKVLDRLHKLLHSTYLLHSFHPPRREI